jgi:2-keto-4-pentenoate hydratase/2-oxohepta-3-ene-1,7-dioic acid hydratase in catechol pathway
MDRRSFLKVAGATGLAAATTGIGEAEAAEKVPAEKRAAPVARGMARGLTLLTFRKGGQDRLGVKTEAGILDVQQAASLLHMTAPATMDDLLQNEDGPRLEALVAAAAKSPVARKALLPEAGIAYGPLVTRPGKIVCVGLNYRKHAVEIKFPIPKQPVLFSKFNNSLCAHQGTIPLPAEVAKKFDYEVELVIVMGREARNVAEADALSYVAGYCTGNDFSARDLQFETGGQWLAGKTSDFFAPVGPYLVTAEQVDPDNLGIECRVNGETRQSSNTNDLIFNCRQMISYTSRIFPLSPGDIIFTGTPEGVVFGKPPEKQVWLKAGDRIACSVANLGELRFDLA